MLVPRLEGTSTRRHGPNVRSGHRSGADREPTARGLAWRGEIKRLQALDLPRSLLRAGSVLLTEFRRFVIPHTVRFWSPSPSFSRNVSRESRLVRLDVPRAPSGSWKGD